ncbi:unnamed protein product [Prorocentrum cordatum]|uniref:Uncharacterized protein n=1 Tax=Prorocentrum cordatum TaxID=2364126 RepID=A0ABN9T401_9DINO|nr:unnamed protein product [Polarella glacialis]
MASRGSSASGSCQRRLRRRRRPPRRQLGGLQAGVHRERQLRRFINHGWMDGHGAYCQVLPRDADCSKPEPEGNIAPTRTCGAPHVHAFACKGPGCWRPDERPLPRRTTRGPCRTTAESGSPDQGSRRRSAPP